MAKLQTKEEVLACLKASIENSKMIIRIIAAANMSFNGGTDGYENEVLEKEHRIRLLKCYDEKEGEENSCFLEVYYDKDAEGKESLLISFNAEPDPDPEKCVWHTYQIDYEHIEEMAETLAYLQQRYYEDEIFEGTVWEWVNASLDGKIVECKITEDEGD